MRSAGVLAGVAVAFAAPALAAQGKPAEKESADVAIPETAWPPAGMCRVWLRDVPERQQPAPTDCVTALRMRPRDATLLMGEPIQDARRLLQVLAPAADGRGSPLDDAFGRRGGRMMTVGARFDRFDRVGTMSPAEAMRAAEAAGATTRSQTGAAAATKADPPKAAVIKPPEQPQH
jgi:hypothetical protein